jgi:hypothetical protein
MDPVAPNPPSDPSTPALAETVQALALRLKKLETLFLISLSAIILLSLGFNFYMARQVRFVRSQYDEQSPGIKAYAKSYHDTDEALMRQFSLALQQYASTNKDFSSIWDRCRPALTNLLAPAKLEPPAAKPASNK